MKATEEWVVRVNGSEDRPDFTASIMPLVLEHYRFEPSIRSYPLYRITIFHEAEAS